MSGWGAGKWDPKSSVQKYQSDCVVVHFLNWPFFFFFFAVGLPQLCRRTMDTANHPGQCSFFLKLLWLNNGRCHVFLSLLLAVQCYLPWLSQSLSVLQSPLVWIRSNHLEVKLKNTITVFCWISL